MCSLYAAIGSIQTEVWVVDNASTDGSINYLQSKYSDTKFIRNESNVGFAKANNQALQYCTGKYVLFLNPDTIIPEDCLTSCLSFIDAANGVGALGVRMIDGSGNFLPESKRSFPSPLTSFYKLAGLGRLFPGSKIFSRYALGYLSEHQNHEVDVLSGAFFLGRKDVLVKLGGFDEKFFMYGEDIDLSFRLQKSGLKNIYFSGTTIIHFKGESTRKGSLNYVRMFYQAMSIFVKRHYTGNLSRVFVFLIQTAIWLRAAVSGIVRLVLRLGMPLVDTLTIYAAFAMVNYSWVRWVRGGVGFIKPLVDVSLPGFTLVFLLTATLAGIYDKKYRPSKAFYAAFIAVIVNLAAYSLLPERFRFSRGVVLFGGVTALLLITFIRWVLITTKSVEDSNDYNKPAQKVVVGSEVEFKQVKTLFEHESLGELIIGRVDVGGHESGALGTLEDLIEIIRSMRLREVIFCQGTISYKTIIDHLQTLPRQIAVRFYSANALSVIGSDSKNASGEYLALSEPFLIDNSYQRRMKHIVDIFVATLVLITFPVHLVFAGPRIVLNAFWVFIGSKTWISYSHNNSSLPALDSGVLSVTGHPVSAPTTLSYDAICRLDYLYAKNYDWKEDLKLIVKNYRRLGQRYKRP
ncbi:MAG: glycosyltransferase family 2 protein [Bacteroidota bacterium]|nr:glycosyltransferase family 2 protein [Bacteroidota bacterium]